MDEEKIAEPALLAGFDDDLATQITAASNRWSGMHAHSHPALERAPPQVPYQRRQRLESETRSFLDVVQPCRHRFGDFDHRHVEAT